MKILFLTSSVSRKAGGLFNSVRQLGLTLAPLGGVGVVVHGLQDEFSEADAAAWTPLPVVAHAVVGPSAFGYAPGLGSALARNESDLIHTHGIWQYFSITASAWHRRTGRPGLVSPRGMLDHWALNHSRLKKLIAGWLYENAHLRAAACLHALCESEARAFRQYGLKNPICTIPNGVNLPTQHHDGPLDPRHESDSTGSALHEQSIGAGFRPGLDSGLGPPEAQCRPSIVERLFQGGILRIEMAPPPVAALKVEGKKVLLYLGRLHPKKGLVNLLKAWANLGRAVGDGKTADWVLAIAGWDQWRHQDRLLQLCDELGVPVRRCFGHRPTGQPNHCAGLPGDRADRSTTPARVLFLGPQFGADKAACFRNCDAFILPSFSEGLPMAVLEAWAYAKPVLMTPECNLPEGFAAGAALPLQNGQPPSGLLRARPLREALGELLAMSDQERMAMGAKGRALVAERFAWPKIAAAMKAVYAWVLGSGPKPGCVAED